ncbi:somatoliberin isoform X1 [Hemicordylus capensis]|uniref:somatoliberin isoform X1 n=1 Tax=Hemicordylus capensis TaxID=884348 RepID=UPI002303BC0C|nr:somatoliberin isoform X1 [Hemicordylus capensis]XP_053102511.1 somatoliberin isoform X1 [Hemicordylus capensis]XP_053102512.1 somatoliberin isoform X1 [Hemicordylus capensis]XP_053102513.1 somatoliberin isoform X1 [Hemicordylus capensis]XP_053102514.1 somatoliberin isoform X1 [Hemicordylus capensis]XP_053102515.1 somatoliberin isoform X1 [Hemicordylus capensis]
MLDRAIFLLFLHFVMCSLSSPLYPALRYSPLPITGKVVSFQLQESGPVQSHNLSVEEQEEGNFLTDSAEKRMQRHADAIFTDHYRKVLSAQKILQGIYGKRLGAGSPRDEEHGFLTRRQSDSILMDSRYQQQMVLKNFLGAMLQNQSEENCTAKIRSPNH